MRLRILLMSSSLSIALSGSFESKGLLSSPAFSPVAFLLISRLVILAPAPSRMSTDRAARGGVPAATGRHYTGAADDEGGSDADGEPERKKARIGDCEALSSTVLSAN